MRAPGQRLFIPSLLICASVVVGSHATAQRTTNSPRSDRPVKFGIVIDNSASLRAFMPQVIEAGKALTDIWPDDRVFVVRFVNSEKTKAVQDLTSDKAALVDALDRMYTEEGLTAILDAVYKSAQYLTEKNANDPAENRRALILITDGLDERSDYKLETVISRLRASGVKVFAIGFPQAARQQGANMERMATDFLTRLAEGTGGRAYFPRSTAQITTTAQGILYDLRNH